MSRITFDFSDFDTFISRMQAATDLSTASPMQAGALSASNAYHAAMRARFAAASLGNGTWQSLAPYTVKQHAKIGDDLPHILHFFGNLELSMERSEPDHVLDITADSIIEGTENFTAQYHQYGTPKMPARPILVFPDSETVGEMKVALMGGLQSLISGTDSEDAVAGVGSADFFNLDSF